MRTTCPGPPRDRAICAAIHASAAGSKYTGTGIGVAVIDSGLASHPDFYDSKGVSKVVYREDFVCSGCTGDPYGHGTHRDLASGAASSPRAVRDPATAKSGWFSTLA